MTPDPRSRCRTGAPAHLTLALHAAADGRWLATDEGLGNDISDVRFTRSGDLLLVSAYDLWVR